MEMNLVIGTMTFADIEPVLQIDRESFPTPWSPALFEQELRCAFSRNLVAKRIDGRDAELAGYICTWFVAGEMHVQTLAVRKALRKRGIASRLVAEAMRAARTERISAATLEVRRSNRAAFRLYEKFGFVVKGIRPRYYHDTGDDALIMWADLDRKENGQDHDLEHP